MEGRKTAQDSFPDTASPNSTYNLVLDIVVILGHLSNIPSSLPDHVMSWDEVLHQDEHSHDNVLRYGDNIAAGDFSDGNTSIGLVSSVQINMIGSNASGDRKSEILGSGQTLGGKVSGVESVQLSQSAEVI